MQIKTTVRYYLTPVRMAIIKKIYKNTNLQIYKNAGEDVEKSETSCSIGGKCKLIQPLFSIWKTVWSLKKLGIKLPYDPTISLLGIYPEKTIIQKDTCALLFVAALFMIARTWKQPGCPSIDEWIKKLWYIHTIECCCCLVAKSCPTLL